MNPEKPVRSVMKKKSFECEFCGAMFVAEQGLIKHGSENCKHTIRTLQEEVKRLQNVEMLLQESRSEVAELTKKMRYLEGTIEGMKNGRIGNNNVVQRKLGNLPVSQVKPFTINEIKDHLKEKGYTQRMFERGFDGLLELFDNIARRTTEEGIERSYVCLDSTRLRFYRLNDAKSWESDLGGFYIDKFVNCVSLQYELQMQEKYGVTMETSPVYKQTLTNKLRNEIKKRYSIDGTYNPDGEDLY